MSSEQTIAHRPARNSLRLGVYWQETKYELIKLVREPMYPSSVIGFPIIFFLLFGLSNGHVMLHGQPFTRYLVASYSCFGSIGASLLAIGGNIAYERGHGWLELKRAFPMPPAAFLVSKLASSLVFCVAVTVILLIVAAAVAHVAVTPAQALSLIGANLAGGLVFASLGVLLGLWLAPATAPGMLYMIYLPLSLCGGLWMPIDLLPNWLQAIAPLLPSYYCAQLAYAALDYPTAVPMPQLWLMLLLYAGVCAAVAGYLFRRQEARR
ncbi:MAG: ABC transporter permease [Sphingomonas sp.]